MPGSGFWQGKPPPGVGVDAGHPLAPSVAWLFNEGSGNPYEAIAPASSPPTRLSNAETTLWKAGKYGPELSFPGDNFVALGQLQRAIPTRLWFTVAAIVTPQSVAAGQANIIAIGRAGESGVTLGRETATLRLTKNGQVDVDSTGITLTAGDTWFVSAQVDAAGVRFYARNLSQGGISVATTSSTTAFDVTPYPTSARIGGTQTNVGSNSQFWIGEISTIFIWHDRRLTNEQIDSLVADPYQAFAPPVWRRYFIAAGAIEQAAGTIAAVSTITGTLTATVPVSATVAGVSTATGTATAIVPITGTVAASATITATATATVPISATVAGASTATGAILVDSGIEAAVSATSTVAGALVATVPIAATIAASSTLTGDVEATVFPLATVAATSTISGTLSATVPISATVAAASTVTGELDQVGQEAAAGTISSTSTVTGTLSATVTLAAIISASSTISAALAAAVPISGTCAASSVLLAAITASVSLLGTIGGVSTVTADLTGGTLPSFTTADGLVTAYRQADAIVSAYSPADAEVVVP